MAALVASTSLYRQGLYRSVLESAGLKTLVADRATDCVACLRQERCELLVIESFLPWGGCDGVLEVAQNELGMTAPVIVVAAGVRAVDWLHLSRYRIDDFLPRFPAADELRRVVWRNLARQSGKSTLPAVTNEWEERAQPAEKRHHPEGSAGSLAIPPPTAGAERRGIASRVEVALEVPVGSSKMTPAG